MNWVNPVRFADNGEFANIFSFFLLIFHFFPTKLEDFMYNLLT